MRACPLDGYGCLLPMVPRWVAGNLSGLTKTRRAFAAYLAPHLYNHGCENRKLPIYTVARHHLAFQAHAVVTQPRAWTIPQRARHCSRGRKNTGRAVFCMSYHQWRNTVSDDVAKTPRMRYTYMALLRSRIPTKRLVPLPWEARTL